MVDKRLSKMVEEIQSKRKRPETQIVSVNLDKENYEKVISYLKEQNIEQGFSFLMNEKLKGIVEEIEKLKKEGGDK